MPAVASYPAARLVAITPSDATDLTLPDLQIRAIYCGTDGNVRILARGDLEGSEVTFAVLQGVVLPVAPKKILATGTTAMGLIGFV